MAVRTLIATAAIIATAATAVVLLRGPATGDGRPSGVRVGCASQAAADFPGAYASRRNLVVGPLVLVGGASFSDERTVREHGGNKFPLLVRAGHTVTVSVPASHRTSAGLAYRPRADGPRAGRHTLTFVACSAGRSLSSSDGPVTFWPGFVLTRVAGCVPLDVWVDDTPRRRVGVPLGGHCAPANYPSSRGSSSLRTMTSIAVRENGMIAAVASRA